MYPGPPNPTHWVVRLVDLGIRLATVSDMVGEVGGQPRKGGVPTHPTYADHDGKVPKNATYTLVPNSPALVHLTLREVEGRGVVDQGIPPCSGDTN